MKNIILFIIIIIVNSLFLSSCGDSVSSASQNGSENISFKFYEKEKTTGVASISCPSDMIAISAGCYCDITTTGEIFSVSIIGDGLGAICGCGVVDLDDYDVVKVSITCTPGEINSSKASLDNDFMQKEKSRLYEIRAILMQELKE